MNHFYRVIWNAATATWTAVAETARGHGKAKSTRDGKRRYARALFRASLAGGLLGGAAMAIPQTVLAQSVAVASGKTNTYVAPNGTTVVNIDTANAAGLSHNRYNSYNVNDKGLVLNNTTSAQIAYQSQLAGQVTANFNMTNAARVILNEVVSNNRSTLAGFTEVLGGRADVILANPYGITCSGCGFINTDRVTLTTGVPYLNANGSLGGFTVNQGDILINGSGLNATAQQMLDLVARTVKLDGTINAQDLSITAGANRYDYVSRSVTGAVPGAGTT
ncbi:filamentous hemagglutinin N-terminal domain-containing protein, partial [Cupriavidus pampae]